ncbi:MAG TPA: mevalonate kinase [Methanocorpusculum sp.]|nr:mevalonate kinase [Methanocorpusculum sp.]
MATWSAPGKLFLFGEHAVVYGKPGIAMAIKPRVTVTVRESSHYTKHNSPYISECFRMLNLNGQIYVRSQLPSASGLGSSSAITVATMSAINDEFNLGMSKTEIAHRSHQVELSVQNMHASATDTYTATFGGMVLLNGNEKRRVVPQSQLHFVIGNSLTSHNTANMVAKVSEFHKQFPNIVNPIFDVISIITMKALYNLNNPVELGRLMDMNHALLDALGVGHPKISNLVLSARSAGAYGAKITGAGGGGCMYALCPKNLRNRVVGAIEGCQAHAIVTSIDTEGARKEKDD